MISSAQHTAQYNTIFNLLLFFITVLFFLTRHILLFIFNYFLLFILSHTRLLSSRFLHFILLNFITSSSILLHLRFAFLLVRLCLLPILVQPCFFSSFEFQISQYDFFFSCTGTFVHFIFFFFPFEVFWFTECKFVLVLRTINFFLSTNFMLPES